MRKILSLILLLVLVVSPGMAQPRKLTYLDVKDLVAKAADLVAKEGFEAGEHAFLTDERFKFGEFYVNVIDLQGNWLVYPPKPDNKGKTILNFIDEDGVPLGRDILRVGLSGEGWTEYRWKNPATGNVAPKLTYVMRVPGQPYIVYGGLYK